MAAGRLGIGVAAYPSGHPESSGPEEDLDDIDGFGFALGIGPGIYDIHSPRVPSVEELRELIAAALKHVPTHRLWINPDCGLKTRNYPEVRASLANLVAARQDVLETVPVTV